MNFGKLPLFIAFLAVLPVSAEKLSFDAKLSGWTPGGKKKVAVDQTIKPGSTAIRLENGSSVRRILDLKPDTRYKLTFLVKGKDISTASGHGARIMLNAGKQWGRITASPGARMDTGTFDWKKGSGIIDTAKFQGGRIAVILSLTGQGTVWFTDIDVAECTEQNNAATGTLNFDDSLSGWSLVGKKKVVVDHEITPGTPAIRLEDNSGIRRLLVLEPSAKYKITFRVKGQDIESEKNRGARIMLNAGKQWGRISSNPKNVPETGTFDWKEGSGIIDTSKFPSPSILCYFSLSGTGTVWYEKISIEKLAAE